MTVNTRRHCPVARGADLVGDRWSLLILRNLILDGPQRFQDLANALEGISPTTLSARLKALQKNQLIKRDIIESHPPRTIYELTEFGETVRPVIRALGQFGGTTPPET